MKKNLSELTLNLDKKISKALSSEKSRKLKNHFLSYITALFDYAVITYQEYQFLRDTIETS